jgi:hypothetical protein
LDPSISKGSWSEAEDFAIIRAHATFGNSWSRIANLLPGRCAQKKKKKKMRANVNLFG